jgi:tetratricopeptide (TPR) repeat protein
MITHPDENLKQAELEGLVLDKFLVDTFKPKICHERDIVVLAFLVKQKESAQFLSGYLAQGTFDIIDVDASSSPDENGHYLVLVEMNRTREMFIAMDNIIKHITDLVNIHEWRFKPYAYDEYIDWNKENFIKTVPQNPDAYFSQEAHRTEGGDFDSVPSPQASAGFDIQLLGEVIDRQIIKSTRTYIKALQKQFKSYMKSNKHMLQSIEDLRSDHQYMHQQLELYEKREKMALLREQQDYKHIRTLENQLSLVAPADSQIPEMVVSDSSIPITISNVETSDASAESKEVTGILSDDKDQLRSIDPASKGSEEHGADEPSIDTSQEAFQGAPSPADDEKLDSHTEADRFTIHSRVSAAETSQDTAPEEKDESEISFDRSLSQVAPLDMPTPATSEDATVSDKSDTASETDTFIWGGDDTENAAAHLEAALERKSHESPVAEDAKLSADSSTETVSLKFETTTANDASQPPARAVESALQRDAVNDYIAQGLTAVRQKAYQKAIECFSKAFDLAPNRPRISLNLAILHYRLKDYEKAQEYGERALDLGAKSAQRILKKVEAKLRPSSEETLSTETTESLSEAILWGSDDLAGEEMPQEYKAVKESDKGDPSNQVKENEPQHVVKKEANQDSLLPAHQQDSKHQDAKSSTQTVQPQDKKIAAPESSSPSKITAKGASKSEAAKKYFAYGLKAFEQKKYDKAIEYFRKVIQIFPNARRSFIRLSIVYYRLKDYETAREHAQRALDLGSKSARRILNKVEAKMAATSGTSQVDEFADTLPEFPTLDFKDLANLPDDGADEQDEGAVEEKKRKVEQPVEMIEETDQKPASQAKRQDTLKPEPKPVSEIDSPESENAAATVAPPPSVDAAEGSTDSENAEEFFNLGLEAAEQKDYHKAIEYFTKVTGLLPDAPPSFLNLANIQLELKNFDAAREHARQALDLGSEAAKRVLEKIEAELWTSSVMSSKPNPPDLSEAIP